MFLILMVTLTTVRLRSIGLTMSIRMKEKVLRNKRVFQIKSVTPVRKVMMRMKRRTMTTRFLHHLPR